MTMRNSASQNSGRKSKNNTFSKINADEISEDLSLGLILDDRDDLESPRGDTETSVEL